MFMNMEDEIFINKEHLLDTPPPTHNPTASLPSSSLVASTIKPKISPTTSKPLFPIYPSSTFFILTPTCLRQTRKHHQLEE